MGKLTSNKLKFLKQNWTYIHYVQWRVICSPNLVPPSCIEGFTPPPKPTSNLTVLPICSEDLLNLLTLLASSFHTSTFGCHFCCCCWFACFSCSLGGCRAFHFGDFFQASAGSSSHLAWPAWSAGLSLPCYQSLEWQSWTSEIGGATCLWCPYASDLFVQDAINVCSHRSGLFFGVGLILLKFGRWHINVNSL